MVVTKYDDKLVIKKKKVSATAEAEPSFHSFLKIKKSK